MAAVVLPYLVFPCTQCGKFTYAKVGQKARKCGICGKTMVVSAIHNGFPAKNVNDAAKLAMSKNSGWLAAKGIHISTEEKPRSPIKMNAVTVPPSPDQLNLEKLRMVLKADGIADFQQVPLPYLRILYDTHSTPPLNFDQFYRFLKSTMLPKSPLR